MFLQRIQEGVARLYYNHGLLCARHPICFILLSSVMVVLFSLPFLSLPMSMTIFHQYTTPLDWFHDPSRNFHTNKYLEDTSSAANQAIQPQWFSKPPVGYVLQVVVNASVYPWQKGLAADDAFKGPLSKAFDIDKDIKEYVTMTGQTMQSICYYVSQTTKEFKPYLPQHSCLVISPANAWTLDRQKFLMDAHPVKSLLNLEGLSGQYRPDLAELLVGFSPWNSGFKRHTLRSRSRQITYAVTLILHTYNESFVRGLKSHLQKKYSPEILEDDWKDETILHIHYKNIINFRDTMALGTLYALLLLYVYFSVSRIQMVKSKWGLAISATVLVLLSPLMAVGVTLVLGIETTLNEGEIFPYLVIVIGLENTLVLTKSVVATPLHLEVPLRIAKGLSKEGWSITKNFGAMLVIICFGYFTFVPALQEFCLLALIAMLTDYFLQMCFFVPVLSLDFRRLELSDLQKATFQPQFPSLEDQSAPIPGHHLSTSLYPPVAKTYSPFDTPSPARHLKEKRKSTPNNVPFFISLASLRILQRLIMLVLVVWIFVTLLFVYHSGIAESIYSSMKNDTSTLHAATNKVLRVKDHIEYLNKEFLDPNIHDEVSLQEKEKLMAPLFSSFSTGVPFMEKEVDSGVEEGDERFILSLWLSNRQHWRFSAWHWPAMLMFYNVSFTDRYISILPPVKLHIRIPPIDALHLRKEAEELRVANAHTEHKSVDEHELWLLEQQSSDAGRGYPASNYYYFLTLFLGILSGASLVVLLLLLKKCVVVKQSRMQRYKQVGEKDIQLLIQSLMERQGQFESIPQEVKGHKQEIECLKSWGSSFLSCCLGGEIRFWDPLDGRCSLTINRAGYCGPRPRSSSQTGGIRRSKSSSNLLNRHSASNPAKSLSLPRSSRSSISGYPRSVFHKCDNILLDPNVTNVNIPKDRQYPPNGLSCRPPGSYGDRTFLYDRSPLSATSLEHSPSLSCESLDGVRTFSIGSGGSSAEDSFLQNVECVDSGSSFLRKHNFSLEEGGSHASSTSPVWCIVCDYQILVAGCRDGKIEVWDVNTGLFLSCYDDNEDGVTRLLLQENHLVVSRLDGSIQFLKVLRENSGPVSPSGVHNNSMQNGVWHPVCNFGSCVVELLLVCTLKEHKGPINEMLLANDRVVTAGQDHVLKVFQIDIASRLWTLHGHLGGVTTLGQNKVFPEIIVSGSTDAMVRLWDVQAGVCVHQLKGHSSTVLDVTLTTEHVSSIGMDSQLCIWARQQGWLLHAIQLDPGCSSSVVALLDKYIITGAQGYLVVWDIENGEPLRIVELGDRHQSIRHIVASECGSTVMCDFGKELRLIQIHLEPQKDD